MTRRVIVCALDPNMERPELRTFRSSPFHDVLAKRGTYVAAAFDREFSDEGISGATMAAQRPGFADLIKYAREGDELHVYALDRIGRDALDVQSTVRALLAKGVRLEVKGIGTVARGVGEIVVAVLAQIADLERQRIAERCEVGRDAARASLATTGRTHRGKESLGRRRSADPAEVKAWRSANSASIKATAEHFGLGTTTVKRYML